MEQGGNVSLDFLKKVASALGLVQIPVSGDLMLTHGAPVDGLKLLAAADAIAEQVETMRDLAMGSLLPSERELRDARAVAAFAEEHIAVEDDEVGRRLTETSRRLASTDAKRTAEPDRAQVPHRRPRAKSRRRSS
jgi:hypothetical protein